MKHGKFNIVVDGQWGSCGKGLIASFLAKKYGVQAASTNNLPNAGHTAVLENGSKFVSKILPVSSFLNTDGLPVKAYVGPGGGFYLNQLLSEIDVCGLNKDQLRIHPRAMVVTEQHAQMERGNVGDQGSTKHIASTMQGSGAVQAERLMRGPGVRLAADFPELADYIVEDWIDEVNTGVRSQMWLHEGSQGFSLGMLHGSHYPQCTSRECTTARELTDMGLPPQSVGDVYVVIRPYPIRVGNVVEGDKVLGYSGDCYPGQNELTWDMIHSIAGFPPEEQLQELTTVTKRLRRVFTFSLDQVRRACVVNGATAIALNFANYIDHSISRTNGVSRYALPLAVADFANMLERELNLPVTLIGTGPQINHVWAL